MAHHEDPKAQRDPRSNDELAPVGGRYRIAAVAELTGVPEPTLRAWERRYGIPVPARTPSGYRLYAEEDVRQVRDMRRLCEAGVGAAEAAKIVMGEASVAPHDEGHAPGIDSTADPFGLAIDAILDAVKRFDAAALDQQLRRLSFLVSATELLERVLAPALVIVGDRWHAGELSVAQEHFASFKLGTVMRDFLRLVPGADAAETVVLGSFADDEHDIGLLVVAVRMAQWGMRPLFLGARTPPSAVRSAVEGTAPKLVALSVTVTPTPARSRELVEDYAAACRNVPWIIGGAGVAPLANLVKSQGGVVIEDTKALHAAVRPHLAGRAGRC